MFSTKKSALSLSLFLFLITTGFGVALSAQEKTTETRGKTRQEEQRPDLTVFLIQLITDLNSRTAKLQEEISNSQKAMKRIEESVKNLEKEIATRDEKLKQIDKIAVSFSEKVKFVDDVQKKIQIDAVNTDKLRQDINIELRQLAAGLTDTRRKQEEFLIEVSRASRFNRDVVFLAEELFGLKDQVKSLLQKQEQLKK